MNQNLQENQVYDRQIFMDTETTGLEIRDGNRILEIGGVEVFKRKLTGNNYHQYIQPDRESEEGALRVHGITSEFLADKPRFAEIVDDFMEYVKGAELIIHNAPFDVGYINHELSLLGKNNRWGRIEDHCKITDSLVVARGLYPGQRNSLDALCRRLGIDNSNRVLHGALLDSEILADVFLTMTGGQKDLGLEQDSADETADFIQASGQIFNNLPTIQPTSEELGEHQAYLEKLFAKQEVKNFW